VFEFGLLGPLEVRADGREIQLGGARPRAVFAVLALHANEPVSAERLAVALWGEDAPPSAVKTVQVYVARLRKALEDPDALVTTPAGYRLRVRLGELDADRFERHVADGREALAAGRAEHAAAELRAALELWRGPPLADLASAPFAPAEIARLEEQRLAAVEVRVDAELAAGRHAELIGELQQLTNEHPWRERLHAQLMLALYRSGRQADALDAYQKAREVLVDELGIEPGTQLHDLQQAILAHDPEIDAPRAPSSALAEGRGARSAGPGLGDQRLPVPPNRTVGREQDLVVIGERLRTASTRLLTLTGPGGVGKTRLSLEAARAVDADFADGAHFVSLAAVARPEDVPAAIVTTLGIVSISGESHGQTVERFLAAKHLLLVADNFEHVTEAAPFVGGLLSVCPSLTVLATSREPLSLQAEQRYPVSPLALPEPGIREDPQSLGGVDAVALFTERARAGDPNFDLCDANAAAVAEVCRRLDGLPLAIELAAARCGVLSPAEIAERLGTAFGALGAGARDAPARQQTLRATIDWSHDLLSDEEKTAFAGFAVFAGGATVEAAETITSASLDTLDRLVAKSLLVRRRQSDGHTRLTMLETIRAYATERLAAAADEDALYERHYRHYLTLAQAHGADRVLWGTSHHEHLAQLDTESHNLRAALRWAVGQGAEPALALCAALGRYWQTRSRFATAVDWIDQALMLPGAATHPELCIPVLGVKAWSVWLLGRSAEQPALMAQAEAMARALADPVLLSQVLETRAEHEGIADRLDVASTLADEALHWASVAGDRWAIAVAAKARAMAARSAAELRERVDRAATLLDSAGNVYQLAELLAGATYGALCYDSDRDASRFISRAIPIAQGLDNPHLWMLVRGNQGYAALLTGEIDVAREAFREELLLSRERVVRLFAVEAISGLAAVAAGRDNDQRAARLFGAAAAHGEARPDDPVEARVKATIFEPARIRSGNDAWNAARRAGAELSFEDAITYALEDANV
jgi:predicted ATPase/DNA-binding SARP family transcriptional activator